MRGDRMECHGGQGEAGDQRAWRAEWRCGRNSLP